MEEEARKTDFTELAKLILEGVKAFPSIFLESFCLPHDCFRDTGYTPDKQTIAEIKAIFRSFAEKYDLGRDEMRLITAHSSHGCCSNPLMQLARRWLAKKLPLCGYWDKYTPDIWKRNEVIIIRFHDSKLDLTIAESLFIESNGQAKVRLISQFGNYYFPIVDQGNHSLSSNLNAAIPRVVVGPKYGDGYPIVFLDLNSVLHQKQEFEFLRGGNNKAILGRVNIYDGIALRTGQYLWEPDFSGIYRNTHNVITTYFMSDGKKRIEIIGTTLEEMLVFGD